MLFTVATWLKAPPAHASPMTDRSSNRKASVYEIVNDSGSALSNDDGDGAYGKSKTDTHG